jgi:hypothetical protein
MDVWFVQWYGINRTSDDASLLLYDQCTNQLHLESPRIYACVTKSSENFVRWLMANASRSRTVLLFP